MRQTKVTGLTVALRVAVAPFSKETFIKNYTN